MSYSSVNISDRSFLAKLVADLAEFSARRLVLSTVTLRPMSTYKTKEIKETKYVLLKMKNIYFRAINANI